MPRTKPIHPALFALYPILFLASRNPSQVPLARVLLPCLISVSCAALMWLALSVLLKSKDRAAVITSGLVLVFYSYGHAQLALLRGPAAALARASVLLSVSVLLALAVTTYFATTRRSLDSWQRVLNISSTVLIVLAAWPLAAYHLQEGRDASGPIGRDAPAGDRLTDREAPPIYYIVLDGYASEEILRREYGYDNGPFVDALEARGFFVPPNGRSNYATTVQSLVSSLNLDYFHNLLPAVGASTHEERLEEDAIRLLRDHQLQRRLRSAGYSYVHFASSSARTGANPWADVNIELGRFDEFSLTVIRSTLLFPFDRWLQFFNADRRERILNTFSRLGTLRRSSDRPLFVFAHVISPHPPYVFGPNGENVPEVPPAFVGDALWHRRDLYLGQLTYVNSRVLEVVDRILAAEGSQVIIVIQGDHGPASLDEWDEPSLRFLEERFGILNAIHLPEDARHRLYPSITPVNTFRIVLNSVLGDGLETLPDRQLFSTYENRFQGRHSYVDVTERFVSPYPSEVTN